MSKHVFYKDAWQAIGHSMGRFIALVLLMLLGTFAFIGLKITGPDMRQTGIDYFHQTNLADMTVSSPAGLDQQDRRTIADSGHVKATSYGYYADAPIKGSTNSVRVFSNPTKISKMRVTKGRLPHNSHEIALSNTLAADYRRGQMITLPGASFAHHRFKVVGFVKTGEYVSRNDFGRTNVGTGQLTGMAVTKRAAFALTQPNIARLTYRDTATMNPYSDHYNHLMNQRQENLLAALNRYRAAKYREMQSQLTRAQGQVAQLTQLAQIQPQLAPQARQAAHKLAQERTNLQTMGYPTYTVNNRGDFPGYSIYRSNSSRVDTLANVFPTFLFAIAALVALTTMTRFVEEQRITIGTLRALGYTNADVAFKFMLYSLLASGIGVLFGALGGFLIMPKIVMRAYAASSTISGLILKFSWVDLLISLAIAVGSTTLAALYALSRDFKEHPAALLLPKPPKAGSRILLERLTWLWRRLSFNYKVTFRNLFRYKTRALMTIFGVAGCVGLLVMGIGLRDSLAGISERQYSQIIKYNLVLVQKSHATAQQTQRYDRLLTGDKVSRHQAIYTQEYHRVVGQDLSNQPVTMVVPQTQHDFAKLVNVQNPAGQHLTLPANGVILTQKMAHLLHAKKGDRIWLRDANNDRYYFKVAGVARMYMGHFIFMSRTAYQRATGQTYQPNAQLVTLRDSSATNVRHMAQRFIQTGALTTTSLNLMNQKLISDIIGGLNTVITVLLGIATILAMVVLYNLTNINVSERVRELSTIKVLGFFDREVTMYIYRETIILTIIGIAFGYLFGIWLHAFLMVTLPPDSAMFDNRMYFSNFLISTLIPAVITAGLAVIMHRKIQNINMLDALKSVD